MRSRRHGGPRLAAPLVVACRSHRRRSRRPTANGPSRAPRRCSRSRAPASPRRARRAPRATSPARRHPMAPPRGGARPRPPARPTIATKRSRIAASSAQKSRSGPRRSIVRRFASDARRRSGGTTWASRSRVLPAACRTTWRREPPRAARRARSVRRYAAQTASREHGPEAARSRARGAPPRRCRRAR